MRNSRLFEPGREKTKDKAMLLGGTWYRQGGAAKPLYLSYPWQACLELTLFGERIPWVYHGLSIFFENNTCTNFMPQKALKRVAEFYRARIISEPGFLPHLFDRWLSIDVQPFTEECLRLEETDLSAMTNEELLAEWQSFADRYLSLWRESIFLDSFDIWGSEILESECKRLGVSLSATDLQLLTTPHTPSWIQKKDIDLFSIIERSIFGTPCESALCAGASLDDLRQQFPNVIKELAPYAKKYSWSMNDFATIRSFSVGDVVKSIRDILEDDEIREAYATIIPYLSEIERKKKECIAENDLTREAQYLFESFVMLSVFRDHRKAYNQMGNGVIHRCAYEASRRSGIALELIERLFCAEVPHMFSLTREDVTLLERRMGKAFYLSRDSIVRVGYYGEDAQEFYAAANADILAKSTLKGMSAYEGVVCGTVRLIFTQDDFSKMQIGDILVAPNTRPEYVPVMRKAAAMITEEGGITCHAAIVSRELKKPCIVGVQSATIVLHDGDHVEVDATSGVVKRL